MSFWSKFFTIFVYIMLGFVASVGLGVRAGIEYNSPIVGELISLAVLVLFIYAVPKFKERYLVE